MEPNEFIYLFYDRRSIGLVSHLVYTDLPIFCPQIETALDAFRRRNISMTFERAEHSGSCLYDLPPSDYSCSREQFPSSIIGRGSKNVAHLLVYC